MVEFEYLRLSCQGSSRSGYQAGMSDRVGVASAKREAQAQIFRHAPDLTVRPQVKVNEKERNKERSKERKRKVTVTQGRTSLL